MSSIFSPHYFINSNDQDAIIECFCETIKKNGFSRGDKVGLYLDLCGGSVLLLKACIKSGLCVAFCPLREPTSTLGRWLSQLGITTVFSATHDYDTMAINYICLKTQGLGAPYIIDSSQFISIIRTSGTTAMPKNAVITDAAHRASARSVNDFFNISKASCLLLSLPLHHVSGLSMVYRSLMSNASLYVVSSYEELKHGILDRAVSHVSLVPAQLKRLMEDGIDCGHLEAIIIGGDILPPYLSAQAIQKKWLIYATYGLTETASMIMVKDCLKNVVSLLPHAQIKIADDKEMLVGGDSLFSGYLIDQNIHRPFFEGWFCTGDTVGDLDQLQLIVRKHNRIITGGENVQPEEVELILEAHPSIDSAVVMGMPDNYLGNRLIAFIRWQHEPLALPALQAYLARHIASYKWPKEILPWPQDVPPGNKKPRSALMTKMSESLHNSSPHSATKNS